VQSAATGVSIMARMVKCVKLGRELPGLDKPPFPGELGKRIYENISKQAYDMWPAQHAHHQSLRLEHG